VVSGGEKMVGLIAVVSCSFILGYREGLSDKKVFEQRPEGSEGANFVSRGGDGVRVPSRGDSKCKSPEKAGVAETE